ncbi:hypothetical protein MOQ_001737, partial [Trypanosoma cruzi marinkellei]
IYISISIMSLYLHDLGPEAVSYRHLLDEVKRQLDITYDEFDCWIYGFLENKKYNIRETVAKLQRRFAMEVNELATYNLTDYMRQSLRSGIVQFVGHDKLGRSVLYVMAQRDHPVSSHREENKRTFDMMLSYGTRLRADSKRCQMVMLINQEKASLWSNVDMTFQADIALRIAKFFPGAVDKMYICNMNRTLAAVAKPIFSRLPAIVSDRIIIVSDSELKAGKLLEYFDESVLPVALGGGNDCDHPEHWVEHATLVEGYYTQLKEAVLSYGLSVKEWERTCLERRHAPSVMLSTASDIYKADSLATCYSVTAEEYDNDDNDNDDDVARMDLGSEVLREADEWKNVMRSFPRPLALFFMEELQRWRIAVESEEIAARYKILDEHIAVRREMDISLPEINVKGTNWYKRTPVQLRFLYRFGFIALGVLNGVYFFAALVFLAVLSANVIATLFFGFFVRWNYIFPLGATLVMAFIQGFALCSRAVEMLVAMARGKVIRPFETIGTKLGSVAQMCFFVVLAAVQFIVFCIYATLYAPWHGLQVSFAVGWLSAVFVVTICHLVFFYDWLNARQRLRKGRNIIPLSLFVLLNLHEAAERDLDVYGITTSSYVICGIPVLLSMFLGIGFLVSRIIGFAAAVCTAAMLASFTATYYLDSMSNALSGKLLRTAVWIASLVWVFDCYAFGFLNDGHNWYVSVMIASIISIWFLFISFICLKKDEFHILPRLTVMSLLILFCATWISSFPIVGWMIGVFCLCLMFHNALGLLVSRAEMTNIGGVFVVSTATLLIIMSCTLLGWYGTNPHWTLPRSLPHETAAAAATTPLTPLAEYHRYPVCSLRTANGLVITDLALLTQLVNSYGTAAFFVDFKNWFNSTDFSYSGIVQEFSSGDGKWLLHRFDSTVYNQTVLVLYNGDAFSSMLAMTAWLGSIALSPLHIFLPASWSNNIVYIMSFVTQMIDFPWRHYEQQLVTYMRHLTAVSTKGLILTGSGVVGGIASMAGAHAQIQTVVFGSPGLLHLLRLTGLTVAEYHKYVLTVGASNGVLDNVGGQDITMTQKMFCNGNAVTCLSMEYISRELIQSCDTFGRRHI